MRADFTHGIDAPPLAFEIRARQQLTQQSGAEQDHAGDQRQSAHQHQRTMFGNDIDAGPELLDECRKLNGCPTGGAKMTSGHRLRARYVIHAVGPVWQGGARRESELLESCYRRALRLAAEHGLKSIAFPCISTGVYRFPKDRAAKIAVDTIMAEIQNMPVIEKVLFVCFAEEEYLIYKKLLKHNP